MRYSTAKVSKLNKYIKSPAIRKFPYILWRSRNSFLIEMERNERVYDCVCVWPQSNSAASLLTHRSRAKCTTCRSRQFTIRFLEHFRLIRISMKFIHRSPSDNGLWLFQIMVRYRTCDKPLSQTVMAYFIWWKSGLLRVNRWCGSRWDANRPAASPAPC